ncbi:uncharacterized protein [Triticum aestivum]|uniref:uncharacterized protein isoform X5 n=1 Tax=Triticum aestivum TaxID=4565 RepID=UPI001D0270E3|nr:uncharacterized protein LOC123187313 isoform X5 [Triticum aestivum]
MACTGRYSPSRWWPSSSTPIHICLGFYGRPAQSPTDSFSKQYNGHSRSASDLPSPPHGECPAPYHAHTVLSPLDASGLCSITGQHQRCEQKKGLVIGHPSFFIEVAIVHLRRGHPAIFQKSFRKKCKRKMEQESQASSPLSTSWLLVLKAQAATATISKLLLLTIMS